MTTTTASSGSSSSSDTGGPDPTGEPPPTTGFVPGGLDVPEVDQCDTFLQDCPDGEKCVPYASSGGPWNAHKCVPILGDQGAGEPCHYSGAAEATDDCDATSACWNVVDVDGEAMGTCHLFCTGTYDNPMCPPDSQCLIGGDSTITFCIPTCDPLIQNCDAGLGCYWSNISFNCILTTQDLGLGEPCGFINDCAPSLLCLDASLLPDCNGASCCVNYCDLNLGDSQCADTPGTACVAFFLEGTAPPDYEHIGVCISPQP